MKEIFENKTAVFLCEDTIAAYMKKIKTNPFPYGTTLKSVELYHRPVAGDFISANGINFSVRAIVIPSGPGIIAFGVFIK